MKLSNENLITPNQDTNTVPVSGVTQDKNDQFSFVILGNKEKYAGFYDPRVVASAHFTENYLSARTRLIRLSEQNALPDMIILQIPFNRRDITSFVKWLRSSDEMSRIPVVYNDDSLTTPQVVELESMNLVDDILRISGDYGSLSRKAGFLGKVKTKSKAPRRPVTVRTKKVSESVFSAVNRFFKRSLDIIIASLLIIFLSPVFLLISLAIAIESRGPIIYTSRRAGRGFKVFSFFKFRTMVDGADKKVQEMQNLNQYAVEKDAPWFFKVENDPRITKIGAFLRNTSLDELPQLFNVLKGDMSLVGNRPLPLYEAASLTTDEWAERFMAPAGMTGLWQIKKRGKTGMSVEERISLDIEYARNNTLMKDLWIMANTPKALMQKSNV